MDLRRVLVALLVAFPVFLLATPLAIAQEGEPSLVKGAVLDLEKVQREALVYRDIRTQIDKYDQEFGTKVKTEEDALRQADLELARQRTILSPEAFEGERRKLDQKLFELDQRAKQLKQWLNKSEITALRKAQAALHETIAAVAKENSLTLIMRHDQLVFWAKAMEITESVIRRLDENVQHIEIPEPAEPEPAPGK
jgi:Skp family chaperone for outer membrane proteins